MSLTQESETSALIPPRFQRNAAAFPPALRALLDAELTAGNTIAEAGQGFPTLLDAQLAASSLMDSGRASALPASAYFVMAGPVTTRAHESGGGVIFRDHGDCYYSGSFTDERGHFFILEPPAAPPGQIAAAAIQAPSPFRPPSSSTQPGPTQPGPTQPRPVQLRVGSVDSNAAGTDWNAASREAPRNGGSSTVIARAPAASPAGCFERSTLQCDPSNNLAGYDLNALAAAAPTERRAIEGVLVARGIRDSGDVEVLAALRTPRADQLLTDAIRHPDPEIRLAVMRCAWRLIPQKRRTASLVQALHTASPYGGLCEALDEAADFHPPEVIDALLDGYSIATGNPRFTSPRC